MLLPSNIKPENSIYYNGAIVLKKLQDSGSQDILSLYSSVRNFKNMTFAFFLLCLDWLFLIGVVRINNQMVELCSSRS